MKITFAQPGYNMMATAGQGKRIGFIGTGRMATALACGLTSSEFVSADSIIGCDVVPQASERFKAESGARVADTIAAVFAESDVVFLAVKPQQIADVLCEAKSLVTANHLVISIAAGVPIETLTSALGDTCRIVRVMPNSPCLIGRAASAYALSAAANDADGQLVEQLLSTVGLAVPVREEWLDAVTGLSGSGPAYVYQFIEALSDGGVRVGLPRDIATSLAAQTVLGAAQMVLETSEHPGALKDAVTSPGGTTIAGLHALEQGAFRGCLMNAVEAATLRSRELGKSS